MKLQQIEPQPARGKLREEYWNSNLWIAEEKYDGDRRLAHFCEDGIVHFTGRRKSVKDGLFVEKTHNIPQLSNCAEAEHPMFRRSQIPELDGTVLDGEMIVPADFITGAGGKSKHVTSIMGSLPAEAVRKQLERGWLRYAVFDCLFFQGHDLRHLPLSERKQMMLKALQIWGNEYAKPAPWASIDKKNLLESIEARGGEGLILKHWDSRYGEHLKWVKVKFKWNADVVITGYKDAKEMSKKVTGEVTATKYAQEGLIGAIVFSQYRDGRLWECGNTSGFDEAVRRELSDRPNHFLGRVIEIEHCGREVTGKFRHPQFKGFREDKAPEDCVYREEEV